MMSYKDLIESYEADVQFPGVSGMEHLDMLMNRSEIVKYEAHFTGYEKKRLREADRLLLKNATKFYSAIRRIADLAIWRVDEKVPPSHWWWFLDVVVQLPSFWDNAAAESEPMDREFA
jgi:hypothetical protein